MFKALKGLFSSSDKGGLKPHEYTNVTYHHGERFVTHDGLNLMPESQPDPMAEPHVASESVEHDRHQDEVAAASMVEQTPERHSLMDDDKGCGMGHGAGLFHDDSMGMGNDIGTGLMGDSDVGVGMDFNPATGLPMMDTGIDIGGNMFGTSDNGLAGFRNRYWIKYWRRDFR
jgi:hypothetical protein